MAGSAAGMVKQRQSAQVSPSCPDSVRTPLPTPCPSVRTIPFRAHSAEDRTLVALEGERSVAVPDPARLHHQCRACRAGRRSARAPLPASSCSSACTASAKWLASPTSATSRWWCGSRPARYRRAGAADDLGRGALLSRPRPCPMVNCMRSALRCRRLYPRLGRLRPAARG